MSERPVILASPRQMDALWRGALSLHEAGRHGDAAQLCHMLIGPQPKNFDALHLCGFSEMRAGNHAGAAALLRRAIALRPGFAPAHFNLGVTLRHLERLEDALLAYDRTIALDPAHARAHNNRATVLRDLRRHAEGLAACDSALALDPRYAEAHSNRGNALRELGRLDEALDAYAEAIALKPEAPEPHHNHGNVLKDLGRLEEALASYDRALACKPDFADAHSNRANALADLGRLDLALAGYDAAIALKPELPDAHWNKSLALLLGGRYAEGWRLAEWRKSMRGAPRTFAEPEWTGAQDLADRHLFIHFEQGIGDMLQFSRFLPELAARGARVTLSLHDALVPLLRARFAAVEVIGAMTRPAAFDFHIPMMSLPHALGITAETIPPSAKLAADPVSVAGWAGRLGVHTRPRIGLAWAGNPDHPNDRNRSVPLAALRDLASLDLDWISLQKAPRAADAPAMAAWPELRPLGAALTDFADTAALVANLDLVLTVDTSVAHLAATMAKPTWILLPYAPDWRWGLRRSDSPWYPSVRLFRQTRPGDWAGTVPRAAQALRDRFA